MGISKDMKKTKDIVEAMLRDYPETRDCDKTLWLKIMRKYYGFSLLTEKDFSMIVELVNTGVSFGSVSRRRRLSQEQNEAYRATPKTEQARAVEAFDMHEYITREV